MGSFVNTTGSNNSMLFSSNQIPSTNSSCGGQCTSYQNGGGYGFSVDQTIPGFRLPEVNSYLNVGVKSDSNLGASKQFIPNTISGGKRRNRRGHGMRRLRGGANDIFYGFTGNDASVPAFRGSYPPMTLGNNASVGAVGGRGRSRGRRMRYMGGNQFNGDNKNTFYGFNGENNDNISLFKGSYAPVAVGDNDLFTGRTVGGASATRRRNHSKKRRNHLKSKRKVNKSSYKRRKHKTRTYKMKHMKMAMPMYMNNGMDMGMSMSNNNMMKNMNKTKKYMRSNLFKSLIGGRRRR